MTTPSILTYFSSIRTTEKQSDLKKKIKKKRKFIDESITLKVKKPPQTLLSSAPNSNIFTKLTKSSTPSPFNIVEVKEKIGLHSILSNKDILIPETFQNDIHMIPNKINADSESNITNTKVDDLSTEEKENKILTENNNICIRNENLHNLSENLISNEESKTLDTKVPSSEISKIKLTKRKRKLVNCRICGKSLTSEYLKLHEKAHTNPKPFSCDKCVYTGKSAKHLKKHQEIHGEAKYFCDQCDYKTWRVAPFRKHKLRHQLLSSSSSLTNKTIPSIDSNVQNELNLNSNVLNSSKNIIFPNTIHQHELSKCFNTNEASIILNEKESSTDFKNEEQTMEMIPLNENPMLLLQAQSVSKSISASINIFSEVKEKWVSFPERMMLSNYMASDLGRIYGHHGDKVLRLYKNKGDYYQVNLVNDVQEKKVHRIHRLIYAAFNMDFDYFDKIQTIDHINRCKADNKLSNLRSSTMKEQALNKNPRKAHYTGIIIIQISEITQKVVGYWLSITEILLFFPKISSLEFQTTFANRNSVHTEGYCWMQKKVDSSLDKEFRWVDVILPPNNGNLTKVPFKVCREGLIRHPNGIITPGALASKYRVIRCRKQLLAVNRIICRTFNGPFVEGKNVVDHIDGSTTNNHSENLEAVTPAENVKRGVETKRKKNGLTILQDIIQFDLKGNRVAEFMDAKEAEMKTGISKNGIMACVYGWRTTMKGFYWKNSSEVNNCEKIDVNPGHEKLILARSLTSNYSRPLIMRRVEKNQAMFVKEFENATAAIDYLKLNVIGDKVFSKSKLLKSIKGDKRQKKRTRYRGFLWEYKDSESIVDTVDLGYCYPGKGS